MANFSWGSSLGVWLHWLSLEMANDRSCECLEGAFGGVEFEQGRAGLPARSRSSRSSSSRGQVPRGVISLRL